MTGFWISLAVLLVAVVAGTAFVVYRGICLYRRGKRTAAALGEPIARIEAVTEEIERRLAEAEASAARLHDASARLALSRARLDVQLDSVRDARARVRRMIWFAPGI